MPTVDAYRRAPLVNPAYVPLSDAAVQIGGTHAVLTQRVLQRADISAMSPLDAVLSSKLGGYARLPAAPDVQAAAQSFAQNPLAFIRLARAALMVAAANKDKDGMLRLLDAMRTIPDALSMLSEEDVFSIGTDALRLASELYRRTGQPFLLTILERLRSRLPDVSGLMHTFPFTQPFVPQSAQSGETEEAIEYHRRMQLLATGSKTADALAMTTQLALYSGSRRDAAASKAGLAALARYHGMPCGAFSADPYLAGRDPARAVDVEAVCVQAEALCDVLCAGGDLSAAEQLEILMENALADLLVSEGIRPLQPTNRLCGDDSCEALRPEPQDTSTLLRALYAIRRVVWMARENDAPTLLLPMDGGCLTRIEGVPVRLTSHCEGFCEKTVSITVEAKQPVRFALSVRVPAYAREASVRINGGAPQSVATGALHTTERVYRTGDSLTLSLLCDPRYEAGYRGSISVFCGPNLMALPLPEANAAWQYALDADTVPAASELEGKPCVLAVACAAPGWQQKNGFITPPPQGLVMGQAYQLTLLPYAGCEGRIAAFPQAVRK